MEISHEEGVGFKPAPRLLETHFRVSEKKLEPKGGSEWFP
jgi:hypothetical protein